MDSIPAYEEGEMKTIGPFTFPDQSSREEAEAWEQTVCYLALHRTFLLIATTRIEGKWKCYGTPVPGHSHEREKLLWKREGLDVGEAIARAAFPRFAAIPYAR